ncbi:ATP-dependent Lon protease [Mycoplasmopsis mustelae]|uniref:endopeptidase La n=1 Tax=Mycoplasmopsis mustelae TaxID=171289 RepID=A0A4R7UFC0_9BACT|nr:endopeptidase La [Mycoplasmopsis mustelae]TDV24384.1 ATP-dependent Lon protease [Mycoplasmopsis mustelae]
MPKEKNLYPLLLTEIKNLSFPQGIHQIEVDYVTVKDSGLIALSGDNDKFVIAYSNKDFNIQSKAVFAKLVEIAPASTKSNTIKFIVTYINLGFFNLDQCGAVKVKLTPEKAIYFPETFVNFENLVPELNNTLGKDEGWFTVCYGDIKFILNKEEAELKNVGEYFPNDAELDVMLATIQGIKDSDNIPVVKDSFSTEIIFTNKPWEPKKRYKFKEILKLIDQKYLNISKLSTKEEKIKYLFSVLSFISFKFKFKLDLYNNFNSISVMDLLTDLSNFLGQNIKYETDMTEKMTQKLAGQHKEFILREKMKWIQDELEEMNLSPNDEDEYTKELKDSVKKNKYPESVKKIIADESKRANEMMATSPEANISKTYVNYLKKLPWRLTQTEILDINRAKKTLSKYHYGLEEVKQRVLEYIAVIINTEENKKDKENKFPYDKDLEIDMNLFKEDKKQNSNTFNNVPIICLVGPPGTGKTSLSKAIAESLSRKFVKISLGGVHDESEIRGHRRTYVGAMPGKIIKGIMQSGVSNPVVLLDEIDKMASTNKGDPASAMLEVLDPEQNTKFQDHYLEHEYDLSKAIFIATANYYENIPPALIDRVEVIELSAYTLTEKLNIAKEHLMPKVTEQVGADKKFLKIDTETMKYIIQNYTKEAGVRGLKRILDKLARKFVYKKLELSDNKTKQFEVRIKDLEELLGPAKYKENDNDDYQTPGVVNGLAYTSVGGTTLQIEVNTYSGKGEIKLTGSLKDVMKESANISLSYVRANAERYGIKDFDFDNTTIHIHVPEGAVPKDGPSAGVTFTTALISSLSKRVVPSNIGMTGEITLRGKVLDIGGLKEKSFAASQKKLKYVFIPAGNIKNLFDVPLEIKENITYIPVYNYDEIYNVVFEKQKPKKELKFKE